MASLILWTSGTTREPKGVMLSRRSLALNAAAKLEAVPQRRDDVRLTVLPLAHAYARTCDFGTWLLSGSRLAVTLGFEGWNRLARHVRPTLVNTVPRMAQRLQSVEAADSGLERLRLLGCGGAPLSSAAFECWRSRGVTVIQGYGLTEAGPVICSATPDSATAGLVGRPVAGWETEIRDGRLFVRGPHTMLGYWNDPHATRAKMHRDGWLDTGDLVEVDSATGQFRILGRADDVIVLDTGRKVHPGEIEQALATVPGVARALVTSGEGGVEAWLDLETGVEIEDRMVRALQTALEPFSSWQQPTRYQAFDPPLSLARGELTVKGTLRRELVLHQRLGNRSR
jgi:long-chain acyl-CoA synthetase